MTHVHPPPPPGWVPAGGNAPLANNKHPHERLNMLRRGKSTSYSYVLPSFCISSCIQLQHVFDLHISFLPSEFPSLYDFSTSSMYYSYPSFHLYLFLFKTSGPWGGEDQDTLKLQAVFYDSSFYFNTHFPRPERKVEFSLAFSSFMMQKYCKTISKVTQGRPRAY